MSTDSILRKDLNMPNNQITADEVINYITTWSATNNADCFAIEFNTLIVGLISLSHKNTAEKSARIGIGSETITVKKALL